MPNTINSTCMGPAACLKIIGLFTVDKWVFIVRNFTHYYTIVPMECKCKFIQRIIAQRL